MDSIVSWQNIYINFLGLILCNENIASTSKIFKDTSHIFNLEGVAFIIRFFLANFLLEDRYYIIADFIKSTLSIVGGFILQNNISHTI